MATSHEIARPRVTGAKFVPAREGDGVTVQVTGEHFVARAAPLLARVGSQSLARVLVRADGRGFVGMLARSPRQGDRLSFGYADEELVQTSVIFGGGGPAPRVA